MTIERARTLTGYTRFDVWMNDSVVASFDYYFDAVDFILALETI
jgi:hypothetical protein